MAKRTAEDYKKLIEQEKAKIEKSKLKIKEYERKYYEISNFERNEILREANITNDELRSLIAELKQRKEAEIS